MKDEKTKIVQTLDNLTIEQWADVVGASATKRWEELRTANSNASIFYTISGECRRLRKILKRAVVG